MTGIPMQRQLTMTPEELAEEEVRLAAELKFYRKKFVEHVWLALRTPSPTRRKELYQKWRSEYGDDIARSYAKYAEACFAGRANIKDIEKMIQD